MSRSRADRVAVVTDSTGDVPVAEADALDLTVIPALLTVEGTLPHYQILLKRDKGLDQVEVLVEVTAEVFSDRISALEALHHNLSHAIENTLGLNVEIRLVEPQSIQRSEGKAKRVIDLRDVANEQ